MSKIATDCPLTLEEINALKAEMYYVNSTNHCTNPPHPSWYRGLNDWQCKKMEKNKSVINLQEEANAIHWVRLAAAALVAGDRDNGNRTAFICNDLKLPKRLSIEKQVFLMLQLIAREPRPFVEYLESGCTHLRRAEVVGNGTNKSPYRAEWRNDYYL